MPKSLPLRPLAAAVPEPYRWVLRVLEVGCAVYLVIGALLLVTSVVQAVQWADPGARVPLTLDVHRSIPTGGGDDHVVGSAHVVPGAAIVTSQVTTTLTGLPTGTGLLLGLGAVAAWLGALGVALALGLVARALRRGDDFERMAGLVVVAAGSLAAGSVLSEVLDGAGRMLLGDVVYADRAGNDHLLTTHAVTLIEFTPLLIAGGLLAVALVFRRAVALQRDTQGLV